MQANSLYFQHFQAAKSCLRREKYGDAMAHLVFLANVEPSSKEVLEEDFTIALRHWNDILERHGELDKLMVCLQEALKLYPQSENILVNTGASLIKMGFTDEAASCFRRALQVNPRSSRAKENLENVANLLVERWHFRMLNDKKRNLAYKQAIAKAISHGHDVVLDIGSGTGILSMFAVQSGAKEVYACEMSKTMYEMGLDVLKANKMEKLVHTIHKKSTEMKVGDDIPERVSLVVTETLDCGLLGEGILATVEHTWDNLLKPFTDDLHQSNAKPVSKIIPAGAVVYAMAIMCNNIRHQTRSKPVISGVNMFSDCSIGGELMEQKSEATSSGYMCDQLEPYSTECLNRLRGGFTALSCPFKVTEYDFNNPSSFNKERNISFEIPATCDGQVDAIAAWFDLQLDEEITLSTGPNDDSLCWEQAVFPVYSSGVDNLSGKLEVSKGDLMSIHGELSQECLRLHFSGIKTSTCNGVTCTLADKEIASTRNSSLTEDSECNSEVTIIPPSYMQRLNDTVFNDLYDKVICRAVETPGLQVCTSTWSVHASANNDNASRKGTCNIIDITYGPALSSVFASRGKADHILVSNPHSATWIKNILHGNNLPPVIESSERKLEEIAKEGRKWDILVSDIVEPSGIIHQQVVEDIVFARGCLLRQQSFQIIPMGFTLYCMCIESPFLFANCCIVSPDNTLGLNIGQFINEFQVTTHVDVDLTTLPFSDITDHVELFHLNFMEQFDDENKVLSLLETRSQQRVKVKNSGRIHAIPYWFMLHLDNHCSLSTHGGAYAESHWRQAAIVLKEEVTVEAGQELLISASCVNSSIFIDVNPIKD